MFPSSNPLLAHPPAAPPLIAHVRRLLLLLLLPPLLRLQKMLAGKSALSPPLQLQLRGGKKLLAGKSTLSLPALLLQLRGGGAQSGSASRNPRLLQPLLLLLTLHCGLPLRLQLRRWLQETRLSPH